MPVEKADWRVTEAHTASALIRTARSLLALALAMHLAAGLALYWQLEHASQFVFLLAGLGAAVIALGMVARAQQHLCRILPPNRHTTQRNDWGRSCSHAS